VEIRKVLNSDIPEISDMCKICFGNPMHEEHYNWLYGHNKGYYSYVMLKKDKIIAHQAIIERKYSFEGKDLLVGLSSGSMILPEYQNSGDFYYILKESITKFKGDYIIGFPNENSHGIVRKLFRFKCIPQNLYQLDLKNGVKHLDNISYDLLMRNDLEWRIDRHPLNKYNKIVQGDCNIIYKEYLGNSIDILYTNVINNDFVDIIIGFQQKYYVVNIISVQSEQLEQIGFDRACGNEFVYKAWNKKFENMIFPCQMIDSDIY
jgi:hypothetical protein